MSNNEETIRELKVEAESERRWADYYFYKWNELEEKKNSDVYLMGIITFFLGFIFGVLVS